MNSTPKPLARGVSDANAPVSEATTSPAPVNGAPSEKRPPKPAQLAVACVLAAVPPKGVTALILTLANPAQQILGVADPYLEALREQLEQLAPTIADLDKLELLVAAAGVDVDAVANKLNDALQLLELAESMEPAPHGGTELDVTLDMIHEFVAGAVALLNPRAKLAVVGKEKLAAIGAQLDHEARVDGQADGAL